jgi:hypothetical protein
VLVVFYFSFLYFHVYSADCAFVRVAAHELASAASEKLDSYFLPCLAALLPQSLHLSNLSKAKSNEAQQHKNIIHTLSFKILAFMTKIILFLLKLVEKYLF